MKTKKLDKSKFIRIATVLITMVVFSSPMNISAASFSDVTKEKTGNHYNSIIRMADQKIINGKSNGKFYPNQLVTRGQTASIIVRAKKLRITPLDVQKKILRNYKDVFPGKGNASDIAAVVHGEIMKGYKTKFGVGNNLTYEQMATILVNAFELKKINAKTTKIDMGRVSKAHQPSVQIFSNLGIITHTKKFDWSKAVTRAEAASLIDNTIIVSKSQKSLLEPTGKPQPVTDKTENVIQEIFNAVNKERKKEGLEPLLRDKELEKVAMIKAKDMSDNGYSDHDSPKYGSPYKMMRDFGIKYDYAAENIATGYNTAKQAMKAWLNSPGHKENILDKHYTNIGIGYYTTGKAGQTEYVQMFTGEVSQADLQEYLDKKNNKGKKH